MTAPQVFHPQCDRLDGVAMQMMEHQNLCGDDNRDFLFSLMLLPPQQWQ
jgi:hypothetical protein